MQELLFELLFLLHKLLFQLLFLLQELLSVFVSVEGAAVSAVVSVAGAVGLHEERILPRELEVLAGCPGAEEGTGHRVQDQKESQGDLGVSGPYITYNQN